MYRALTLEERIIYAASERSPLPQGGCRACGRERDNDYATHCYRCRPAQLEKFLRNGLIHAAGLFRAQNQ